VPYRVNYLHAKGRTESLELLGSPELLGIAESLAGPDFVPTYESLVFKSAGDGAPIPWHQDALHPRSRRITNIDVYLDDSLPGQGALRVLPGSQRTRADVCAVRDQHGWEPPGVVEVALEAGDVLLHDVMLVHGSPPTTGNALRRTLYYEFRSAQQILDEGPFDRSWVERRLRLMGPALAAHAAAFPDATPFDWRPSPELLPSRSATPTSSSRWRTPSGTPAASAAPATRPAPPRAERRARHGDDTTTGPVPRSSATPPRRSGRGGRAREARPRPAAVRRTARNEAPPATGAHGLRTRAVRHAGDCSCCRRRDQSVLADSPRRGGSHHLLTSGSRTAGGADGVHEVRDVGPAVLGPPRDRQDCGSQVCHGTKATPGGA
jgi:hypothetical protein